MSKDKDKTNILDSTKKKIVMYSHKEGRSALDMCGTLSSFFIKKPFFNMYAGAAGNFTEKTA